MKRVIFICLVYLLLVFQLGFAQIPKTISYQGVLTDTSGSPVVNGNYDFTFQLYDVATGGISIWSETQSGVEVANGIFNVILGSVSPLNLPFDTPYWLGITVGTGAELSPRIELTSSAYSLSTSNTDSGNTLDQAYDQGGLGAGRTITADAGPVNIEGPNGLTVTAWVGIGTSAPQHPLHVKGFFKLEGSDFLMGDSSRGGGGRALVHMGSGSGSDDQMILNFAGDFEEGVRVEGSKVAVDGKLGVGTSNPTQLLEVADTIYSSSGGYKFPDGTVQSTAATGGGGGDITAVNAGDGLTGGGISGDVILDLGTGKGINVTADQVSLDTSYTDGRYVEEDQVNSVSTDMIQNNAVNVAKISPDIVSSLNSVTNDGGNIDLVAGSNVNIVANDANNTITISSSGGTGGGDITAVNAGDGLTGGGTVGDVNLDVGAGTGITVTADQVSLNTTYTDGQYVNEAQANSVGTGMIQNDAVTAAKIAPNIVSSLDGISNDAGDIDLIEGSNITITPNDANNTITIDASFSGGNTLDQAYDQGGPGFGRTITADAGAVNIEGLGGLTVNGWVGIGTTTPEHPLHVKGFVKLEGSDFLMAEPSRGDGGRALVHMGSGSGSDDQMILNFAGDFEEGVQINGPKLVIDGNLGIGVPTPAEKLEVAGTVHSTSGGFKFPDGSVQTTASSGGGDNLGNHTATQNINLNGNWISGDGNDEGIFVDATGKVGIGNPTPNANLQADATDGVLFTGTYGSGTIPVEGAGTRMMWYPTKAAFRAGHINTTQWDNANIGNYSMAMGFSTIASGSNSSAMGALTQASGLHSTAMGYGTVAIGNHSTAMGSQSVASGDHATAMGVLAEASGDFATAMGVETRSQSFGSFALGFYNVGGGDPTLWVESDPLFEVGNGAANNPANAMTVLKNGNVGIGTPTPNANLHVESHRKYAGYFTSDSLSSDTHVLHAEFTGTVTTDEDPIGVYGKSNPAPFYGFGGYFVGGWKGVIASASELGSGSRTGVQADASGGSSNNVGVSGTASGGTTTYGIRGFATGGSANNYAVYASGDLAYTGELINLSDARFKQNILPVSSALEKVMRLKGRSFRFTQNTQYEHMNLPEGDHYGLIAQEVEEVLPELVSDNSHPSAAESRGERSDDPPIKYKGLNYIELIPILVEAIKEQQQEIESLKTEINSLKSAK